MPPAALAKLWMPTWSAPPAKVVPHFRPPLASLEAAIRSSRVLILLLALTEITVGSSVARAIPTKSSMPSGTFFWMIWKMCDWVMVITV
jgi:hypothetical protein